MTTPSELFKDGHLADALAAQTAEVKAHPTDHARRLFLFELLCFSGDLDRAGKHLDALPLEDPELLAAAGQYRNALAADRARRGLFAGQSPHFFSDPPEHVGLRWQAAEALRHGRPADAVGLLDRAQAVTPTVSGHLNGTPFDEIRDEDDLLAGVLEVFARDGYYWVPMDQVRTLVVNPPRFPRDLLYAPAKLALADGSAGDVFLPVLYPGSYEHADEAIRLGRMTDWSADNDGPVRGVGQHTFLVDDGDVGLLEVRMLELTSRAS
jgi:type VI secretion system protein ImpE